MKTKILSLVLFLLTALGATAKMKLAITYDDDSKTKTWSIEIEEKQDYSSGFQFVHHYDARIYGTSVKWDASSKKLTVDNPYFYSLDIISDSSDELSLEFTKTSANMYRMFIGTITVNKPGTLKIPSAYEIFGLTFLKSNSCLVLERSCTIGSIKGASDKSTRVIFEGSELRIKEAENCSGIHSITCNPGVGIVSPHGAYIDGGIFKDYSGKNCSGYVGIDKAKSYGFTLADTEVTEANYDLLDKPSRYFPGVSGEIKFDPETNTLDMYDAYIKGSISNNENSRLNIRVRGDCHAKMICALRNTKLVDYDPKGHQDYLYVEGVRIGTQTTLSNYTRLHTGYISGSGSDIKNLSRLCLIDDAHGLYGNVSFDQRSDEATMTSVRLVDIVDKTKPLNIKTLVASDGGYKEIYRGIYCGKYKDLYGIFDKSGNFYKGGGVGIDGSQTIYPLKVGGIQVTSANQYFIVSPDIQYAPDGKVWASMSYDPLENTLYIDGADIQASGEVPAIEYTGSQQLKIKLGINDFLSKQRLAPGIKVSSGTLPTTITTTDAAPALMSSANTAIWWGKMTVESKSDNPKCGAFNVAGTMSFALETNVTVPYVCAKELKTTLGGATVNITKGLTGSNTSFGENTYKATLNSCDVQASANAYYEPDNKYIYATGPVQIVPIYKATEYPFWVFGRQVTSVNCNYICGSYLKSGSLKFNPATNIFEMRDAQVDYNQGGDEPFIKTKDRALNLMLYGENAVKCLAEAFVADGDNLNIMGGECALALTPASDASKSASIHLANSAIMGVYASKPSFKFQRITDDGTGTLQVGSPMTVSGNGIVPTINVKEIELDDDVELLNTLDRPQTLSGGTVINDRTKKPATGTIEFVPKGTSPIYPTGIEIETPTITLAQRGATDRITAKVFPEDATDPTLTWTSSDYNVVQVGTNGFVKAVKNGTATITATAVNGVKATATVTVAIPDPVSIALNETEIWFKGEGYSFILEAIVENEDADQTVEWTCSDKSVVDIVQFGKSCRVERVADEGTAVITAKTVNGLTAECNVKVHFPVPAQTISLSENEVRFFEAGETREISINVGPDDVDTEYLDYFIDVRGGDEEVAAVEINGNTLNVTAKKEGSMGVAIWATCDGTPITYDYLSITVKPTVLAESLTIMNPAGMASKFYAYGQRMQLMPFFTPENVDNTELTWTSSAPDVATVDENGVVTSVSEGYATIKAATTDGSNLTAEFQVEVLNPADWAIVPANGVTLSRKEMILFPGQRYEMTAGLLSEFANTYVEWEVEQISGDGGQVEVTPGNWSDGYDAEPAKSRYADIQAYVPNKAEATFPIVARITVKVRDYEGEEQPTDTCIVTILDDIYFTEANAEGIDIRYHVISGDPENPQCELYAKNVMVKDDVNGWYETVEPAIDGELTGKLIVPSVANGYWVTSVGKEAFSKSKIEEVELPEGLTTVDCNAFAPRIGFDNLKAVTLPSTLKYLGDGAFQGQTNLKQVTLKTNVVPQSVNEMGNVSEMLNGCFAGIASDAVLNVPYNCIDTYFYPGSDWSNWFATIDDGSYLTAETAEGLTMSFHISSMAELTAEVKGKPISDMENELAVDADATEVTIPSRAGDYKVTSISEFAFVNHGNPDMRSKMEKVFIPETIEKIDGSAFMDCKELKEVTINRETPPVVTGAFEGMDPVQMQERTLYVPYGSKEAYDLYPWTTWFGTIEEMPAPDYLPDTDISKIANVIYAASMKANAGETAMLSIRMKNDAPIQAFQFRLTLPEGAELVKMGKNKFMATLNQERMPEDAETMLSFANQTDGTIMFLGGILSGGSYAAGDGEVISMPLNIPEGMEDGEYPIVLQQIKLTEADVANYYETSVVKSTMTVGEGGEVHYVLGDATGDGVVDVSDYTIVANQILNDSTTTQPASARMRVNGFNAAAADINKDDVVDVSDYTGVANIILFGGSNGAKNVRLPNGRMLAAEENETSENLMYVKDFTLGDGNTGEMLLPICMKSEAPIRSFQFDLYLPDGMEAVKTSKGKFTTTWNVDRLPADDEHTLSLAQQSDGAIRVLCGSLYDETFEGEDGVLFTLKVKVSDMADGSYIIALKDIKLSETDITKFYKTSLYEAVMNIDTDTSIDAVYTDDLKGTMVFDLQGRRVQNIEKGIYIVNGKKVVIK